MHVYLRHRVACKVHLVPRLSQPTLSVAGTHRLETNRPGTALNISQVHETTTTKSESEAKAAKNPPQRTHLDARISGSENAHGDLDCSLIQVVGFTIPRSEVLSNAYYLYSVCI
jgi:hypothetical protein